MDPVGPVGNPPGGLQAAKDKAGQDVERLQTTSRELEGVFLGLLMKAMRSTVGNGGLFKNGSDSQTYRDMFDQEIARSLAKAGGIGLAQMVLRDQLRRQAAAMSDEARKTSQVLSPGDR